MQLNALIGDNMEELGIQKHSGPRYSAYTTVESRLKTFSQWPTRLKQTPRAMAQAGFFYLGTNDHVNCFHCGCGLRNWEPEDDPWLEHARWFPQCRFLLLMKGEQYVQEAVQSMASRTRKQPPPPSSSPRPAARDVPEAELRTLLESPIAQTVITIISFIHSNLCSKRAFYLEGIGHGRRSVESKTGLPDADASDGPGL